MKNATKNVPWCILNVKLNASGQTRLIFHFHMDVEYKNHYFGHIIPGIQTMNEVIIHLKYIWKLSSTHLWPHLSKNRKLPMKIMIFFENP